MIEVITAYIEQGKGQGLGSFEACQVDLISSTNIGAETVQPRQVSVLLDLRLDVRESD